MTKTEFFEEVARVLKEKYPYDVQRKPYWGSTEWLKIIYKDEEFRIGYRKSQSVIRLTFCVKFPNCISIIGDYEINPAEKLLGKENIENNKSIFKKIDLDNSESVVEAIAWIVEYIPLMYQTL